MLSMICCSYFFQEFSVNNPSNVQFESSYLELYRARPRFQVGCDQANQPAQATDADLDFADIHDEIY